MKHDEFNEYIQERWEGMLYIFEQKKLNDYALGRAMIKFSRSDNPINKALQKKGMEQAKKYGEKRDHKLKFGLERISEYIAGMIIDNVEANGGKIYDGEVTPNKSGTSIKIFANYSKCNATKLNEDITRYLERCVDRRQVLTYDIKVDNYVAEITIRLFRK